MKVARTVWTWGKAGDSIKGLPISIGMEVLFLCMKRDIESNKITKLKRDK